MLEPQLRVLTAPNPSPMTGSGTQTYLIGHDTVAVVDPGPDLPAHRAAILGAVGQGRLSHILVTHAHLDHSEGARALSLATGAPIYAFGPAQAGRSATMARLAESPDLAGGEGIDHSFAPDETLAHGATLTTPDWQLTALHTPGHFCNHLSFQLGDVVLTGDLVMGWTSTLISPPDGDLAQYYASLTLLERRNARRFYPAHGAPIHEPTQRLQDLRAHRQARHAEIRAILAQDPASAQQIAAQLYTEIPRALLPAATRNTLAHLIFMLEQSEAYTNTPLSASAIFALK